jgi:hypothetical protein
VSCVLVQKLAGQRSSVLSQGRKIVEFGGLFAFLAFAPENADKKQNQTRHVSHSTCDLFDHVGGGGRYSSGVLLIGSVR